MTTQIQISAVPWQEFSVVLDGQNCVIALRQVGERLYADLTVDGTGVFRGRACALGTALNCYPSPYFTGRLYFTDTTGAEDPSYEGLNDRWILLFDAEDDA